VAIRLSGLRKRSVVFRMLGRWSRWCVGVLGGVCGCSVVCGKDGMWQPTAEVAGSWQEMVPDSVLSLLPSVTDNEAPKDTIQIRF
jgi:hypothetical protein